MGSSLASSPVKDPSIILCACSYASLTHDLMTERPIHCERTSPSGVMSQTMENARRSVPGLRLQRSWQRRCGSMGSTRCTRYTLVDRCEATSSSGVWGLTKCETSAMWTPIRRRPPGSASTLRASSRSRAVRGSIVNTRAGLKSLRLASSSSEIDQGMAGRQSRASCGKSASTMPSAARIAAVSDSISPACPMDSRICASG
mmetsp:Transcript_25385/g.60376  ORF Transcript_25385/g.60376 Transcript_25385/m.60376 type:complete len:201 (-) Transcript_25385:1823-2425(-)